MKHTSVVILKKCIAIVIIGFIIFQTIFGIVCNVLISNPTTSSFGDNFASHPRHEPIFIDGDADFTNQALLNSWEGTGSSLYPYIIENYSISAPSDTTSAIVIRNTVVHFIIRNCSIASHRNPNSHFLSNGLYLDNVMNADILNNDFQTTTLGYAIRLNEGESNTILYNFIDVLIISHISENEILRVGSPDFYINHTNGYYHPPKMRLFYPSEETAIFISFWNMQDGTSSWSSETYPYSVNLFNENMNQIGYADPSEPHIRNLEPNIGIHDYTLQFLYDGVLNKTVHFSIYFYLFDLPDIFTIITIAVSGGIMVTAIIAVKHKQHKKAKAEKDREKEKNIMEKQIVCPECKAEFTPSQVKSVIEGKSVICESCGLEYSESSDKKV